jgi:hypothetical protein
MRTHLLIDQKVNKIAVKPLRLSRKSGIKIWAYNKALSHLWSN